MSTGRGRRGRAAPSVAATLRRQTAILLGLVFLCGLLGGLLARRIFAEPASGGLEGPDRVFYGRFAREYRLDRGQRRLLRLVLEEKAKMKKYWWTDLMRRADRNRLLRIDRQADLRIRMLLDPRQRARYEADLGEARD